MNSDLETAIVQALCYADIFDYPLNNKEIWKWLIQYQISKSKYQKYILKIKNKNINKIHDFYCLNGRKNIVNIRNKREKWSRKKLKIAEKVAFYLRFIPLVKLVGVTGALAIKNAREDDDIDLLIVTSKRLLWFTRLLTTLLLEIMGKRRRPGDELFNNKVCLNMFLDESHFAVPSEERDLFSAHEVAQMRKIWDRGGVYNKFLTDNLWVREYLPNAFAKQNKELKTQNLEQRDKKFSVHSSQFIVRLLEELSKRFQLCYMRKRRTSEMISDGIIRFHPRDVRRPVMQNYYAKLIQYNLKLTP